jgi:uncharacterized protein YbjT (DUF2867 family)
MEASKKVLVTGATGFVGRRLVKTLLQEGVKVRCMSRGAQAKFPPGVETVIGDLLDPSSLSAAFENIDTAYYLVHSLAKSRTNFAKYDHQAAENFVTAGEKTGLRRTIYLGGLGETGDRLSEHLASRMEIAKILSRASFLTTIFRAAVIIGAGGASFEIIRSLVYRLPVMIVPRWVSTRCQPIAVNDVIQYLVGALKDERTAGKTFDIGGPEILTYRQMMERYAKVAGEVNIYIPFPLMTPKLSSYWVGLITPVKASIAIPLIEGLRNEVICRENHIRDILPIPLTPYDEAVRIALAEEPENQMRPLHKKTTQ